MKRALIIQGGGFRTAYTAGILDAFLTTNHLNFDRYIAVSGGAIALSYFLGRQRKKCFEAMCLLAKDPHFVKFTRAMSDAGYMDIDYLRKIASEDVPFDLERAMIESAGAEVFFVATDRETAKPVYLEAEPESWINQVIASCTLPFVTKGKHKLGELEVFDGGWSAPIPLSDTLRSDFQEVIVLRTAPADARITQSWPDYFGSIYFRNTPALVECFMESHLRYNEALEELEAERPNTRVIQLAPKEALRSGTYSYTVESLTNDYRHGLDTGLDYIASRSD